MTAHTKMLQSSTILHRFCLLFATVWNLKLLLVVVVVMAKTWDFFNRSSLNKRSSIRFHPLCSRKIFSFYNLLGFANNCGMYKIMVLDLLCNSVRNVCMFWFAAMFNVHNFPDILPEIFSLKYTNCQYWIFPMLKYYQINLWRINTIS